MRSGEGLPGASGPGAGARGVAAAAERWTELQRLLDGALDRPPAARAAYLDAACRRDTGLREEALALLDACERAARPDGLFATPAVAFGAAVLAELAAEEAAGRDERSAALAGALRSALDGRYAVERELGRGGMATVFLAHDLRHDRAVAVKVLERGVAAGGVRRFLQEIRTAARLTHPHVLGVHDSGESDGLLYFVMPYVEGETLRARLAREGALPLPDAVRLLRELADALAYAHGQGVLHRDLKPENVLLSGGHAVVADFGIATALEAAAGGGDPVPTHPGVGTAALGTPGYMAPEQALGDPGTDHRADLYALGVIAYEALAGAHPFGARSKAALLAAQLRETPIPLAQRRAELPPALAALVMRLLEREPGARPRSAEAVLRLLDEAVGPVPSPAGRAPSSPRRVVLAGAAALLAAAAAGYALWLASAGAPGPRAMHTPRRAASGASAVAPARTVAVLPFENIGGSPVDDYFSDGLTDELANALARLPGLRVAGRTSSYAFKGKAVPAGEIGRALGVRALVVGTVRRAGERLRVSTQLVSAADGKVLWDSVFESRSRDVFAVQDEFTRAMAVALGPALGGAAADASAAGTRRGTADQEAYELYLKGRYYWLERGTANVIRAIGYFRQAVARDPSFARAHAGLAMAYSILPLFLPDDPTDSATTLAVASARRALALDSTVADAQLAMGWGLDMALRFRAGLERYRAAVRLEPSSVTAHHWLGFSLLNLGRTDEALVELRHATVLDPLAASPASAVSTALLFARRFPEAAIAARHALALDSTFAFAIWTLGLAQAFGGQPDSAVLTLERGVRLNPADPRQLSALLLAYAAAGRWTDAERLREQLRRPGGDPNGGTEAAFAELVFGAPKPLARLLGTREGQRSYVAHGQPLGCNPLLDPLWRDGGFRTAMRALGVEPCRAARPWPFPHPPGRARRRVPGPQRPVRPPGTAPDGLIAPTPLTPLGRRSARPGGAPAWPGPAARRARRGTPPARHRRRGGGARWHGRAGRPPSTRGRRSRGSEAAS